MTRAETLLRDLVAIPSVNPRDGAGPGEAAVAAYVRDWLAGHGIAATLSEALPGRPNVVAVVPGRDPRAILLESHMDTVETAGMSVDPHAGTVHDGRLYGRGACDAKGPLAAFLLAAAELAAGPPPPRTVILAAVVDEEHRYRGVLHLLGTLSNANAAGIVLSNVDAAGIVLSNVDAAGVVLSNVNAAGVVLSNVDAAIVGEPTGLTAGIAHKGVVRYTARVLGRAGHTSRPAEAVNAVSLATRLVEHLDGAVGVPEHPLLGGATRCVTRIHGGTGPNIVPGRCDLDVDRRTLPGEDPDAVWRREADELRALLPGRVEVDAPFTVDYALDTPAGHPVVAALCAALDRHGLDASPRGMPFCTDASKLARAGIPAVVFGPGSILDAHAADESVALADVELAASVVVEVVRAGDTRSARQ